MADQSRRTDAMVGAFVLAALLILIAGSLWIAGTSIFGVKRLTYHVRMMDSGGIDTGDRVRIAGVSVGRVQAVRLHPQDEWPVEFVISLRPGVELRADGSAKIAAAGLLGAGFLQIDPGSAEAALLPVGGEIQGTAGMDIASTLAQVDEIAPQVVRLLDKTGAVLDQVSEHLGPTLAKLDRLLAEENVENVRRSLATLRETVDGVGPRIEPLLAQLEAVAGDAGQAFEQMPELLAGLTNVTEGLEAALGPDGARLTRLLDSAESSLGSADQALGALGDNRSELGVLIEDLRQTVANLKSFSQQIEERPFSLVRIKPPRPRAPGDGVGAGR